MLPTASRIACIFLFAVTAFGASASENESRTCEEIKIKAAGRYAACLARADISPDRKAERCEQEITKRFAKAERRSQCPRVERVHLPRSQT